jgi:hypothetical protein
MRAHLVLVVTAAANEHGSGGWVDESRRNHWCLFIQCACFFGGIERATELLTFVS